MALWGCVKRIVEIWDSLQKLRTQPLHERTDFVVEDAPVTCRQKPGRHKVTHILPFPGLATMTKGCQITTNPPM